MIEIIIVILILILAISYYAYRQYLFSLEQEAILLKHREQSLEQNNTYTSIEGWDFPHADIVVNDKIVTHGLDAAGCANLCKSTPSCVGTSYNTSDTACWLKSKLENGRRIENAVTQVMSGYEIPKETNDDYYKSIK